MKQFILISFVFALAALTGYWGIASENMAKSFPENRGTETIAPVVKPSGKLLIVSDIHFNPFSDPTLFKALRSSDYTKWKSIFESSTDSSYGNYHADTYYRLFKSTLLQMKAQNKQPDMIIINGDFLCHEFACNYHETAGDGITHCYVNKNLAVDTFVQKTISFVFSMIEESFPGTAVLPVLGNNDDYCGDYYVQPSGPFLKFFASKSQPMLNQFPAPDFMTTFSRGGYYRASMPWDSNQVFIGINSVFFSSGYSNKCNPSDTSDPGAEQLGWLEKELKRCEASSKKVWLSCHIPPSIDVYKSTEGSNPCMNQPVTMWKSNYNTRYLGLVSRYSKVIMAGMAGHTHMDDFRLIGADNALTSFIHITPAVSPIFGNNPAFQEITWQPASMRLINSVTYRFSGIQNPGNNLWGEEYNYAKTYGTKSLDAFSLSGVWKKIGTDSTVRRYYQKYYYVNSETILYPWKAYWCGIRWQTPQAFKACNCDTK